MNRVRGVMRSRMGLILLLSSLFMSGCNAVSNVEENQVTTRDSKLYSDIYSEAHEGSKVGNFVMSPYSLQDCFNLLYGGTVGETRGEFGVLGLTSKSSNAISKFDSEIAELNKSGKDTRLHISNNIYVNKDYEDVIKTSYFSDKGNLHLATMDDDLVDTINSQVEDDTNHKITNLISSVDSDEVAILVNALYFKGDWDFKEHYLYWKQHEYISGFEGDLSLKDVKEVDGVDVIKLDYDIVGGSSKDYSLYVISKSSDNTDESFNINSYMSDIESLIDFDSYSGLKGYDEADFLMPEFHVESSMDLSDILSSSSLMPTTFSDKADFSGIGDIKVSRVVQKVYIYVNRKGTEAAAASAVDLFVGAAPEVKKIKHVIVNDNFLFAIKENTSNQILFIGSISDLGAE
jgi:serpin B